MGVAWFKDGGAKTYYAVSGEDPRFIDRAQVQKCLEVRTVNGRKDPATTKLASWGFAQALYQLLLYAGRSPGCHPTKRRLLSQTAAPCIWRGGTSASSEETSHSWQGSQLGHVKM